MTKRGGPPIALIVIGPVRGSSQLARAAASPMRTRIGFGITVAVLDAVAGMNRLEWFTALSFLAHYVCAMDSQPFSPSAVEAEDVEGFKPRRASRLPIDKAARLERGATYQLAVNVRNVSPCGFMAECGEAVGIGSYVTLDVPGVGRVQAQVRWQIGSRMGGMFAHPISLANCEWTGERTDADSD